MRDLVHSPALTSYGAHLIDIRYPTRSRLALDHSPDSDEYMSELIKYGCSPGAHPAGTCKMGGKDDETAVVDPELMYMHVVIICTIHSSVLRLKAQNLQKRRN